MFCNLILCTYSKFWFGLTIWFGLIESQSMGWQGTSLCMLQGCAAKKDGVLKDFCPKTATELNHHDLKLGLVRKLRERMNRFPFNSKWMREKEEKSKSVICAYLSRSILPANSWLPHWYKVQFILDTNCQILI